MNDMAETKRVVITDIKSLRPELLDLSENEIDRRIAELMMAKDHRKAEAIKKAEEENFLEAGILYETLVKTINRMKEIGYLPERISTVLTSDDGVFNPGRYLKAPRVPKKLAAIESDTL